MTRSSTVSKSICNSVVAFESMRREMKNICSRIKMSTIFVLINIIMTDSHSQHPLLLHRTYMFNIDFVLLLCKQSSFFLINYLHKKPDNFSLFTFTFEMRQNNKEENKDSSQCVFIVWLCCLKCESITYEFFNGTYFLWYHNF